jgi:hypothetical protein
MSEKIFCPAPFMHTWINANIGGFKLCCMSKIIGKWDTKKPLKDQFNKFWTSDLMQNIRQDFLNGKYPEACDYYCGKYEREGITQQVDRLNFLYKYENDIIKNSKHKNINSWNDFGFNVVTGNKYNAIFDLDLRPSKLCNLKCRSCNSIWSTEIEKEVNQHPEIQIWSHWDADPKKQKKQVDWNKHEFSLTENIDFNKIYKLKITGGESFIDPNVLQTLQHLVDNNISKNIIFHTITNCTSYSKNLEKILSKFMKVSWQLSIDGYGKVDDFLRHGQKWHKKAKNIEKMMQLPNLSWANIMHVCQPVSVFHLLSSIKYFLYLKRKYPKLKGVTFNPIIDPTFLHVGILDEDHKEEIFSLIDLCIKKYEMREDEIWWFDTLKSDLLTNFSANEKYVLQNEFVKHQMALDKIRKTDTIKITKQLKKYFDRFDSTCLQNDKIRDTIVGSFENKFNAA